MPVDRHARRFLEMLSAAGQSAGRYGSVRERRTAFDNLTRLVDPPGTPIGGTRDLLLAAGGGHITLRVYSPLGEPRRMLPGMVFFHGGGWVAGGLESHDGLCRRLVNESGCRLVAVDYRLAPEHRFPHGLEDGFAALVHVARHPEIFGIDPDRLGVAGDSAGATFAAAVSQLALARGGPKIAFQLLLCPILDVLGETASRRDLARGYFLDRETMARDLELYVPRGADLSDPRLSPLRAKSVSRLPPAYIHTAQFDPFSEEGEAYAARLVRAGVPVHGFCHPGMIHFFYAMPRMIPHALLAARLIGAEIRHAVQLPVARDRRAQIRMRPELIRA